MMIMIIEITIIIPNAIWLRFVQSVSIFKILSTSSCQVVVDDDDVDDDDVGDDDVGDDVDDDTDDVNDDDDLEYILLNLNLLIL